MRALYLVFILSLFGCVSNSVRPELSTEINYQKDLYMEVRRWQNNAWSAPKVIEGMGVVQKAQGYKFKVIPPGDADMITVLSCHREWKTPNPKRVGDSWFKTGFYEFDIWPTEEHEINKTCSFDTGVYEKVAGRHAWGLIVIESEREQLPATVKCNGSTQVFRGTSVCQAKRGLIQSIHFDRRVLATKVAGCELDEPKDKRNWVYQMPESECVVYFVDEKNPDMIHKAVLFGYDSIAIRGVE